MENPDDTLRRPPKPDFFNNPYAGQNSPGRGPPQYPPGPNPFNKNPYYRPPSPPSSFYPPPNNQYPPLSGQFPPPGPQNQFPSRGIPASPQPISMGNPYRPPSDNMNDILRDFKHKSDENIDSTKLAGQALGEIEKIIELEKRRAKELRD